MMMQNAAQPAKEQTAKEQTAGTGREYVAAFLPGLSTEIDSGWIAEAIDSGALIACPVCHFLRLPSPAFPSYQSNDTPRPACDVCASVPNTFCYDYHTQSLRELIDGAAEELERLRCRRATMLFELWIGGSECAEALLLAAVSTAVQDVTKAAGEVLSAQ